MSRHLTLSLARQFAALLCVALANIAHAQHGPQSSPWSYFTPEDHNMPPRGDSSLTIMSPQPDGPDVPVPAVRFKPRDTPRGAVVIVNSPAGWTNAREGHFGRSLSSAGYVVLAIDSNGPRGVTSTVIDNTRLGFTAQLRDAFAARRYLVASGIPSDRIAVMGSGRGGTVALMAADRSLLPEEKQRFSLAIAITPPCIFHPRNPRPASQILIVSGDRDDYAGTDDCQELASRHEAAGASAKFKIYAGASSGFDGHPAMIRRVQEPFAETFVGCKVVVEADGSFTYANRSFIESQYVALLQEMRKTCMKKGGAAWTNLTQKANVTLEIINFLDASFRR